MDSIHESRLHHHQRTMRRHGPWKLHSGSQPSRSPSNFRHRYIASTERQLWHHAAQSRNHVILSVSMRGSGSYLSTVFINKVFSQLKWYTEKSKYTIRIKEIKL
jgi:hypothetical protein